MDQINLQSKTLEDLRYIAKMMGIKNISKLKKQELMDLLVESTDNTNDDKGKNKETGISKNSVQSELSLEKETETAKDTESKAVEGDKVKASEEKKVQSEEVSVLRKSRRGRPSNAAKISDKQTENINYTEKDSKTLTKEATEGFGQTEIQPKNESEKKIRNYRSENSKKIRVKNRYQNRYSYRNRTKTKSWYKEDRNSR